MQPYLGMPCIYIPRANDRVGGQDEMAAVVTRLYEDGTAGLTVFPHQGEHVWRDRIPEQNEPGGVHCWRRIETGSSVLSDNEFKDRLVTDLGRFNTDIDDRFARAETTIRMLEAEISAIKAARKPGRKPKQVAVP